MRINHIEIVNFRNFQHCELDLDEFAVIVGENKIGKSNLIYALRLILDPKMSDAERQLRLEDFWDGLPRPLSKDDAIKISIDLVDFEDNENLLALLADYSVNGDPMVSRLTYLFRSRPLVEMPQKESDYEFIVYGGDKPDRYIGYDVRSQMPLNLLPALRNAEEDLSSWRRSPLAPLLQAVAGDMDPLKLAEAATNVFQATANIAEIDGIKTLGTHIKDRVEKMVGPNHAVDTSLNFSPTDPLRLIRSLRLFIDGGLRGIADASLGCANLIYLSLLSLELERQVAEGKRSHTFLAIEEPEAHLHPHLQRLAFRDFLRPLGDEKPTQTLLLTTHSPHIASVSPLKSLVVLKKSEDGKSTIAKSTAKLELDQSLINDLERYIDVTRGECVFAKGVILVEGIAEEYIVPVLGKSLGYDFDQLGITVCSVASANFAPYAKLFGPDGLNIPFSVITDLDPQEGKEPLGVKRASDLVSILWKDAPAEATNEALFKEAVNHGIFVNDDTLELALLQSGNHAVMCETLLETTENGAAQARATDGIADSSSINHERFLKDIEEVSKGRYAQRLSSRLNGAVCPEYIKGAITYVTGKIQ
jgi:putative ATP-dependent endonuclease of OLD family